MIATVIGSTAIKHYYPDFPRNPKDIDIAVKNEIVEKTFKELINPREEILLNPVICKYATKYYLEPELLLTLKVSHLPWNINWDKHLFDTQFLLSKGLKINKELFYELYDYWTVIHGKNKRSDLKMTKEDFFDNVFKEKFDHDYLHTLVNPVPTYLSMLEDGQEVNISEEKWNNASAEQKDNLIKEEVFVMAYERYGSLNYRFAYNRMFKKYLISHAPLYVFLYAVKHYQRLYRPAEDFITKINIQLKKANE